MIREVAVSKVANNDSAQNDFGGQNFYVTPRRDSQGS